MWRSVGTGLVALGLLASGAAEAGVYSDDLTKCLVRSTSKDDQILFVQWVFSAMALHPSVQQYAAISHDQHVAMDKKAGALFMRLMTVDCRKETGLAIKYEGTSAIETSFKVLGETAMRGLLSDPAVTKGMQGLDAGFDEKELKKVVEEANAPPAK